MKNAHLRFGWLTYVKSTEKTTTSMKLRLDRFIGELLGERILAEYPALQQIDDRLSPRIQTLQRTPFPARAIAIMGLARRWQQARTDMVVAECGTGKTLISLGAIGRTTKEAMS
jgi:superfamily II DNA or RNA helicase